MADYAGPMSGAPTIADPSRLDPYQLYVTEIKYAQQELKKFHERARKVARKYIDERDAIDSANRWFNLFHANANILKAALYAQMPKPEVKRKYLDYNDDLARVAANILQRAVTPDPDDPRDTFNAMMQCAVLDRLVPGLGICWMRLETDTEETELILESIPSAGEGMESPNDHHNSPQFSGFKTGPAPDEGKGPAPDDVPPAGGDSIPGTPPAGGPPGAPPADPNAPPGADVEPPPPPPPEPVQTFQRITEQRVCVDYVYWEDFLWSPCRVWEERRWVARCVFMDRDELIKRFGEEKGSKIPLNHRPSGVNLGMYPAGVTPVNQAIQRAKVYEFWNRIKRTVCWFCTDYPGLLDEKPDFLNLVGFEPCPKPMLANVGTSNTAPRPDYYMAQDQYLELDSINERISRLVQACKVVGVYDRASDGVQRMLTEGVDNTLIPVDNWAQFAEKGGVKGQVDWLPLEQVINTLQRLYEAREGIKAQIYELTGIADIVRGASKASETLGAQEIKAKFASVRIKDVQDEVARYAGEVLRIKAEIMVKHFDPEILKRKSNIMRTDDAPLADEAIALLQSEEGFEWRITVTSDQMAQADYAMEKQDRIELLTAASQYMERAAPMIQQKPEAAPLLIGMLKWAVAGFRGARDIEGMLDEHLEAMLKAPPEEPPPDPEKEKIEAEMKMAAEEHGMKMKEGQQKIQLQAAEGKMKLQQKAQEGQMNLRANAMKHQQTMSQAMQKAQMQMAIRLREGKRKHDA